MSEVTLFQTGNALPAHLRRGQLSDLTKSLMGGSNTKRISIDNNVFTMMVGGKSVAVNEDRAMSIVIVRAAEHNARTYYGGQYEKGVKARWLTFEPGSVPDPALEHRLLDEAVAVAVAAMSRDERALRAQRDRA